MTKKACSEDSQTSAQFEISGAGVLHVRASEILKTEKAKQQIKAAEKIQLKTSSNS